MFLFFSQFFFQKIQKSNKRDQQDPAGDIPPRGSGGGSPRKNALRAEKDTICQHNGSISSHLATVRDNMGLI